MHVDMEAMTSFLNIFFLSLVRLNASNLAICSASVSSRSNRIFWIDCIVDCFVGDVDGDDAGDDGGMEEEQPILSEYVVCVCVGV